MALPSIRECMQRLDATGPVALQTAEALTQLSRELWPEDPPVQEIADAVSSLQALHQLARDLAANLRNFGTPPVVEPSPKVRAQSLHVGTPTHIARPRARPVPESWLGVHAEKQAHATGRNAAQMPGRRRSPDHIDSDQVAELLQTSRARVWLYQHEHGLPAGVAKDGRKVLWSKAAVLAWKAQRDLQSAFPEGWLTSEQICKRLGYRVGWLWKAISDKRFPDTDRKHGLQKIWPVATVEQWIQARALTASQPRPEREIPAGFLSTKQLLAEMDRTDNWLYAAIRTLGFPKAEKHIGRLALWRRTTVIAWLKTPPTTAGEHNTRKPFGALDQRSRNSTR